MELGLNELYEGEYIYENWELTIINNLDCVIVNMVTDDCETTFNIEIDFFKELINNPDKLIKVINNGVYYN